MKRKLLFVILALVAVFACAFGLTACSGSGGGTDGTYYLYENGNYDKTQYITLKGKKWTDDDGEGGTYTLNGTAITFYAEVLGNNEEMYGGTLSDGVLTIKVFGATMTYCKEGSAPSGNNNGGNGGQTTEPTKPKYTVTYNANGGSFADGGETLTQSVNGGSNLTAPASPSRVAYAFSGWATDKNGKTLWKFASDTVTGNITLYAVWEEQSAAILSAEGATIDEKEMTVFMLVDKETESVSLSNKIVCSSDSVWKLYYDKLGLTEIPTKIAVQKTGELNNGDNIFYMVVTSSNGSQVNVYELKIHRSYEVTIKYYDHKNELLKTETMYTGNEFTADYTPDIAGYTFNHWKDAYGKKFTTQTIWTNESLFADCTANNYIIEYNANGGTGNVSQVTVSSGKKYVISNGNAFKRDYYLLVGFNTKSNGTGLSFEPGETIADYNFANDLTLYAIWESEFELIEKSGGWIITGINNKNYSNISIPKAILGKTVLEIGDSAFYKCSGLTSVTIPDSVTSIGDSAFGRCNELSSVTIGNGVKSIGDFAFYVCSGLTSVTIPDSVTSIGDSAFEYCNELTSVTIGNGVKSIGKFAFYDCSGLTSVTIGNGVKSIGKFAFSGCNSLTNVIIPDSVTEIGGFAFSGCSGLTSVTIPDSVTSIEDNAFSSCSGLTSVTIPDSVTSIGGSAFSGCSGLTGIIIPDRVTEIGGSAFSGCSGLTSVTIPDSVTSIGNDVFYGCSGLTSVTIGNRVTSIGKSAFSGCSGLTSVTIPDSVTEIGKSAFSGCSGLTSVTIGNRVTSIGESAFYGCSGLKDINYNGTKAQWNSIKKDSYWNYETGRYTIHCTDGDISK